MSSSPKVDLKVDWCSYQAAKWAVEHWHYSGKMPRSKMNTVGVWEDGAFVGVVIFGVGATRHLVRPYGLRPEQGCELTRVALREHKSLVSQILAMCLSKLKRCSPGLRLVVSYADQAQGHLGIIYQAANWIYSGEVELDAYVLLGKYVHPRVVSLRYGTRSMGWLRRNVDPNVKKAEGQGKHRYLYPLDRAMRRQIAPLAQPYPKRAGG